MNVDKTAPGQILRCRPAPVADKSMIPNSVLSALVEEACQEIDYILPESSGARHTFGPATDLLRKAVADAGDLRSKKARAEFCARANELSKAFQRPSDRSFAILATRPSGAADVPTPARNRILELTRNIQQKLDAYELPDIEPVLSASPGLRQSMEARLVKGFFLAVREQMIKEGQLKPCFHMSDEVSEIISAEDLLKCVEADMGALVGVLAAFRRQADRWTEHKPLRLKSLLDTLQDKASKRSSILAALMDEIKRMPIELADASRAEGHMEVVDAIYFLSGSDTSGSALVNELVDIVTKNLLDATHGVIELRLGANEETIDSFEFMPPCEGEKQLLDTVFDHRFIERGKISSYDGLAKDLNKRFHGGLELRTADDVTKYHASWQEKAKVDIATNVQLSPACSRELAELARDSGWSHEFLDDSANWPVVSEQFAGLAIGYPELAGVTRLQQIELVRKALLDAQTQTTDTSAEVIASVSLVQEANALSVLEVPEFVSAATADEQGVSDVRIAASTHDTLERLRNYYEYFWDLWGGNKRSIHGAAMNSLLDALRSREALLTPAQLAKVADALDRERRRCAEIYDQDLGDREKALSHDWKALFPAFIDALSLSSDELRLMETVGGGLSVAENIRALLEAELAKKNDALSEAIEEVDSAKANLRRRGENIRALEAELAGIDGNALTNELGRISLEMREIEEWYRENPEMPRNLGEIEQAIETIAEESQARTRARDISGMMQCTERLAKMMATQEHIEKLERLQARGIEIESGLARLAEIDAAIAEHTQRKDCDEYEVLQCTEEKERLERAIDELQRKLALVDERSRSFEDAVSTLAQRFLADLQAIL